MGEEQKPVYDAMHDVYRYPDGRTTEDYQRKQDLAGQMAAEQEQPAKPWPETPKPAEPWGHGQGQATQAQGPGAAMLGVGRPMTAHRPSLGRIVLVRTHGELINGQEEHAAMITQVWSDTCINLTMFPGAGNPQCWTSIQHVSTLPPEPYRGSKSWRWPDRV